MCDGPLIFFFFIWNVSIGTLDYGVKIWTKVLTTHNKVPKHVSAQHWIPPNYVNLQCLCHGMSNYCMYCIIE